MIKESAQTISKRNIRRIISRYSYPTDKQGNAIRTVIEQAILLAEEWFRVGTWSNNLGGKIILYF